jgi:diamine N-acetyltransferase
MNLRCTTPDDLRFLTEIEQRFGELGFVHSDDVCTHQRQMNDPDYAYYTVEQGENLAGYVIMRGLTSTNRSLELKRIVIAEPGHGLGRQVLRGVIDKAFCDFRAHRLWLDVFEDNHRARHVYRSLGFVEENTPGKCFKNRDQNRSLVVMSMLKGEHRQKCD